MQTFPKAALAATLFALAGTGMAAAQMHSSMNAAGTHTNSTDATFVMKAAKSNTAEISQAQAERNSSDANARSFAMRMIHDHGKANTQ